MNPYVMRLVPRLPAASLVITRPPQSPGAGMQTVTRTEGHETAFASEASTGDAGALGLSFRLVKMALLLVVDPPGVPVAVTAPPLMVIGPPSDFTTSPEPTSRFPPWSVRAPSNRYPRGCVDVALLGVIHAGCPASAWPKMASALVDVNRLPLRRTGVPGIPPPKSTVMPCAPPLIDEVVTEIAVFTALMPSMALGPMLLPDTTRP